jgi:hypothetical protein
VYAVAEALRDYLSAHNEKPSDGSAFDEMQRRQRAAVAPAQGVLARELDPSVKQRVAHAVEEDEGVRRKRDGTPVTRETFAAWKAAFEAEMALKKR